MRFMKAFRRRSLVARAGMIVLVFVGFSLLWIPITDQILGWLIQDPAQLTRWATYKGGLYIVLVGLLLFWQVVSALEASRVEDTGQGERGPAFPRELHRFWAQVGVFAALVLLVVGLGVLIYQRQRTMIEQRALVELSDHARLHVEQIEDWLQERRGDVSATARDPLLQGQLQRLLKEPGQARQIIPMLDLRLKTLQESYPYDFVKLTDPAGKVIAASDDSAMDPEEREAAARIGAANPLTLTWAVQPGQESGAEVRLSYCTPILAAGRPGPLGALVFRLSLDKLLVQNLKNRPTYHSSMETLLLCQQGEEMVYLTPTRLSAQPMTRVSMARTELVGVRAMRATTGTFQGVDYRGVASLAASRPLTSLPWVLLAKIDKAELSLGIQHMSMIYGGLGLLFLTLSGLGYFTWRKREMARVQAERRRIQAENQLLEYRLDFLRQHANDIVLQIEQTGRIRYANDRAVEAYGYSFMELQELCIQDLRAPETVGDHPTQMSTLQEEGVLRLETMHRRKNGSLFPVEVTSQSLVLEETPCFQSIIRDLTEDHRRAFERETTLNLLRLLNERSGIHQLIGDLTGFIQKWSGCEAVGIRLRAGEDFPYFETRGFPAEFVQRESQLCARDLAGQLLRDERGDPVLECMCGNILCGRFNPELPFFTSHGSFWSNGTTALLASTTAQDRQARTRNRCNGEGYESVALIPLRSGGEVFGLLQLNDHAKDRFTAERIAFLEGIGDQIALALGKRQALAALEHSEQRFRVLSEAAGEFLWETDAAGTFRFISERCRTILGYAPEELVGRNSYDLVAFSEAEALLSLMGAGKDFENLEVPLISKSGGIVWVSMTTRTQVDARGERTGTFGVGMDITERKLTQRTLQESETRYRKLYETMQQGAFFQMHDGTLLDPNPAALRMFGLTEDEFTGRTSLDPAWQVINEEGEAIPGQDHPTMVALRTGKPVHDAVVGVHNPRTQLSNWMIVNAIPEFRSGIDTAPYRVSVTLHDITEWKRAVDALKSKEEQLDLALRSARLGVWTWDVEDGRRHFDEQVCQLLGIDRNAFGGTQDEFLDMVEPEDREGVLQAWARTFDQDLPYEAEYQVRWKDGSVHAIHSRGRLMRDEAGRPLKVNGILWDVTERKALEASVRQSQERFRNAILGAPYPIMIHAEDGTVLSVNEAWTEVSGYGLEDIPTWTAWIRKADPGKVPQMVLHGQSLFGLSKRLIEGDRPVLTKSGERRIWDFASAPLERMPDGSKVVITMARDVTSQRAVEEAFRQKSDELEHYFRESLDLLCIADTEGYFHRLNPEWEKVLGYPIEELTGRRFLDLVHPEDLPDTLRVVATLGTQQDVAYFVNRYRCKDGSYRWLEWRSHPIGTMIYATARDITEQRRLEVELREKEAKYRRLFDTMHEGFALHEILTDAAGQPMDYRFLEVNPAFEALTGLPRERWIGHTVREILPETEPYWIETYGRVALTGAAARLENHSADLDRWYQVFAYSPAPRHFAVLVSDITERKLAELALQKSERFLRDAQRVGRIGCYSLDLALGIWESSDTLDEILGIDASYLRDVHGWLELVTEESREEVRQAIQDLLRHRTRFDKDYPIRRPKDGQERWISGQGILECDAEGQPIKLIGTMQDITDWKRAEGEIQAKTQLLALTGRMAKVGGWEFDPKTLKGTWTDEVARIHDLDPSLETDVEIGVSFYTPESRERIEAAIKEAIGSGKPYDLELEILSAKGVRKDIRTVCHPLMNEQGEVIRIQGTFQDITERKAAEAKILHMTEELEQRVQERTVQLEAANRELEAFSYSVSHDLRSPLRGIDGFSQALLEDHQEHLDETGRHYLARIRSGAQRMGQLIEDLLKLSRVSRSELDRMEVDLSSLCGKILDDLARANPERRVDSSIQPGLSVQADPRLLRVALENLLGNAWKFTSQREIARIVVGVTPLTDGKQVFFVQDSGAGFDMQYAEKLFDAFQRLHTSKEFEGTGIGLAIVQRIIHRHGGRIWAEAETGKGTCIFFTLNDRGDA